MPIRILITGCRYWAPHALARSLIARFITVVASDKLIIVHGNFPTGVDAVFNAAAKEYRVAVEPHPADWDRYGRHAGPIRNGEMVNLGAAFCLALHRDLAKSRGTLDCVKKSLVVGIPVWLIDSESGEPRQIKTLPVKNGEQ